MTFISTNHHCKFSSTINTILTTTKKTQQKRQIKTTDLMTQPRNLNHSTFCFLSNQTILSRRFGVGRYYILRPRLCSSTPRLQNHSFSKTPLAFLISIQSPSLPQQTTSRTRKCPLQPFPPALPNPYIESQPRSREAATFHLYIGRP